MLLFCEDCGERNIVSEEEIIQTATGTRFKCNACNYLNILTQIESGQPLEPSPETDNEEFRVFE